MAFKLTKDQLAEQTGLTEKLEAAVSVVNERLASLRDLIDNAKGEIEDAVSSYNEIVRGASEFARDIAAEMEEEYEDRSERWQESEKGQLARAFVSEWEGFGIDEIDIDDLLPSTDDIEDIEDVSVTFSELPWSFDEP
jgi:chromosome segregation ATPase